MDIIKLLGHCIGGNLNIHIWPWLSYFMINIYAWDIFSNAE